MSDKCVMVVQGYDNMVTRKGYEDFASMKHEAYHNQADRVLYWWCELEELVVRLHG